THYRPLVAMCRRLSVSTDGEELAQEAFLRAWSSWERYAPNRPFWPWVSTIARRLCIDHGRRLRTAQLRGPYAVDRHEGSAATPEELYEANEEYRWARAALEQLRPEQRRVIRLRDVEGWSYDRIADHEGVTVESVRGSLRRARSRLRLVYAQMSSGSPAIIVLALLRDLRRRLSDVSHRVQSNAASIGVVGARAAESMAAIVVIAMGSVSASIPATAPAHALAAGGQQQGVITPTSVAPTSTTSNAPGAMRDGGHAAADASNMVGGRWLRVWRWERRRWSPRRDQQRPRPRRLDARVVDVHVLHGIAELPAGSRGVRQRGFGRELHCVLSGAVPLHRRRRPLEAPARRRVRGRHGDVGAGLPGGPPHRPTTGSRSRH
ncbi:MAG: sigma-70 family RNA polymerase sigma factor, partial [Actinobacteria bacterium]